jgi:predicted DsbA family dithiol-disulfide isomerase
VVATPTYYIEGYKFEGLHQASVFEHIIDHKLGKSGATPQR